MIREESSAPHDHESEADDTLDAHHSGLERLDAPHGCYDGMVFIGYLTEVDGGEVEIVEAIPCRRCARSQSR